MSERSSPLKSLLVQASHYSLASFFTMLAGLVTFPLLTRIFSVSEYGTMSLIAATVTVAGALGKLGVQHSILRYRTEIGAGKGEFTLRQLYASTFFGMIGSGAVVTLLLISSVQVIPLRWLGDPQLRGLFAIAGFLVLVQVTESALINFLRAEQRTAPLMGYQVAKKYLSLAFILIAVVLVAHTLRAFYTASVLAEILGVGTLMVVLFRRNDRPMPERADFSPPLYQQLVSFGIPMMIGYEMSGLVLAVGDRYVIDGMIGEAPLGLYAAAYNLCQYVQAVFIASVGQAIMPIYMDMWDREGPAQASDFISRSLRRYVLFGAPVVAGLAAVGPELLPSLASEKYASAGVILPWVIAGMVVDGTNAMVGAGLFIHRKTRAIMAIVMSCAALNIGLNILLIPRIGVLGSAIATLVSYAVTSLLFCLVGRSLLPVALPGAAMLRATLGSIVMYGAIIRLLPGHRLLTVGVRTVLGAIVYGAVMFVIDPDIRALGGKLLALLRRKEAGK
jgi:O-antigen/teichoic acid export membrane protein